MYMIGAYLAICILYAVVWGKRNGRYQEAFCRFIFTVFMPILAFVLFILMDWPSLYSKQQQLDHYYIGNEDRGADLLYLRPLSLQNELNKVPMEEALSINTYSVRRKVVMDTLQYNTIEYLDLLKKALNNEDTETSHYATAVIMDLQSRLSDSILKYKNLYHQSPRDKQLRCQYENILAQIIFSDLFDQRNLTQYLRDYEALMNDIFNEADIEEVYYINRLQYDFIIKNYQDAYEVCNRYQVAYSHSENMVIYTIKYYVLIKNRSKLEGFLEQLKDLPVKLTQNSLQYIRFLTN